VKAGKLWLSLHGIFDHAQENSAIGSINIDTVDKRVAIRNNGQ
jgi:hypothetical protein